MRERVSFLSRADRSPTSVGVPRRARVVSLVVTLFLAAPGVAAADDGQLPLVPIATSATTTPADVVESVPVAPAVEAVAEVVEAAADAAPAPVAEAASTAEAIPAAIAPDQPAAAVAEAAAGTSVPAASEPTPTSTPASPEQYQEADTRYHGTTEDKAEEQPAPDAAAAAQTAASGSAEAASATETPQSQFVWNWVWHCAPAIDPATVPFPENLPDNAIVNWVWDSSCSAPTSAPIPDQYQNSSPQYHQQNIVVTIRVNSPGDDGAITQGNVLEGVPVPVVVITTPGRGQANSPPAPLPPVAAPFETFLIPSPIGPVPIPLPITPVVPVLADLDSAMAALAEPPVAVALGTAAPEPQSPQSATTSGDSPATSSIMLPRNAVQPAIWTTAPAGWKASPRGAASPKRATRQRAHAATPIDRLPSGPLPLDPLSTYAAGSAGGGAGSSGLLLSALAALLAAYLLWPPLQWAGVVSVAGGPRKRVDGGRLEKPG
jgi:hypothetical protein